MNLNGGKEFYEKPYRLNVSKNHFCNKNCRENWYREVWSQSKEWKNKSRIRAVKILENGSISKTNSECQQIVNNLLDELNIKYINEYNCKYYAIDNYLVDYNLMIEVMGTYWHSDPRFYNEINYEMQNNQISQDKRKNTYIKNNHNINILYLWEEDVINNYNLCKLLLMKYIENNGLLYDYHSFNYTCYNDDLLINKNIIVPYFEYNREFLNNNIINIKNKKHSRKQPKKWIVFNCDNCGEKVEQLKSRYNKNKHHFCSQQCNVEFYGKLKSEKFHNSCSIL